MENAKLPPIPTPISQRWREFRIQVLPFVAFLLALLGIIHIWRNFVQPVGIVGFVETNQVHILPLQDGLVFSLFVERFQAVTQGQEIAIVVLADTNLVRAQVHAAQADLRVLRERLEVDKVRTDQNYQSFQETLFKAKVDQEIAKAKMPLATNDYHRAKEQFEKKILPESSYDLAKSTLDTLIAEVKERENYIASLTQSLQDLRPKVFPQTQGKDAIDQAIDAKEAELLQMFKPSLLKSPIDGIVSIIAIQQGKQVRRGVPIADITPHSSTNIIGYMRQPIEQHPKLGDAVQVTTRTNPRRTGTSTILKIGSQLEAISPALLSAETPRMELGLPIVVPLPSNMTNLLPGEFVDIGPVSN